MFNVVTVACWLLSELLTAGLIPLRVWKTQKYLLSSITISTFSVQAHVETYAYVHTYNEVHILFVIMWVEFNNAAVHTHTHISFSLSGVCAV